MKIVGAGMAGLLAAGILRNEAMSVVEAQEELPNNHSAVLRFRSPVVGDSLNIPFKKVQVLKGVHKWMNPVADAVAYSLKTNGTGTLRSITSAYKGELSDRYIAPADFIQRMKDAASCDFLFGYDINEDWLRLNFKENIPTISTMPMPSLMKMIGWEPRSDFRSAEGYNIVVDLGPDVDIYCTVYVPSPKYECYRVSITGNKLIAEHSGEPPAYDAFGEQFRLGGRAMDLVGIPSDLYLTSNNIYLVPQKYAKIAPIDEEERRRFIIYATEQYGIYSLGRFATWRPGLLLDDIVNDIRIIQRLAKGQSRYDHLKEV